MGKKGSLLLALLFIALGTYLLLSQLGLGLPGWQTVWPVLPIGAGITLFVGHLIDPDSDPEQVFFGTAIALVGVLFLFVTMGPLTYGDLGSWWPAFVLIAGIAFLAQWVAAGFRDWDALFLGLVSLSVAGVAAAIILQLLGPNTREILPRLWPAVLILAGIMALLRGLLGRRKR